MAQPAQAREFALQAVLDMTRGHLPYLGADAVIAEARKIEAYLLGKDDNAQVAVANMGPGGVSYSVHPLARPTGVSIGDCSST